MWPGCETESLRILVGMESRLDILEAEPQNEDFAVKGNSAHNAEG